MFIGHVVQEAFVSGNKKKKEKLFKVETKNKCKNFFGEVALNVNEFRSGMDFVRVFVAFYKRSSGHKVSEPLRPAETVGSLNKLRTLKFPP